jgi:hypothetical protein
MAEPAKPNHIDATPTKDAGSADAGRPPLAQQQQRVRIDVQLLVDLVNLIQAVGSRGAFALEEYRKVASMYDQLVALVPPERKARR